MYKIIVILLLLSSLCYGQGKYSVRKTYQHEGNDSTKAKLVLTEEFNDKGKVVYATFNEYENWDTDTKHVYYGDGKNYYTYNDTLLVNLLMVEKAYLRNIYDHYDKQETFLNGDSTIIKYEYQFDEKGYLTAKKSITKERVFDRTNYICGMSAGFLKENEKLDSMLINTDSAFRKLKTEQMNEWNDLIAKRQWKPGDSTVNTITYTTCGIYEEQEQGIENSIFNRLTEYTYNEKYKGFVGSETTPDDCYICTKKVYYILTRGKPILAHTYLYKYSADHYTIYDITRQNIEEAGVNNETSLNIKTNSISYYTNRKGNLINKTISSDCIVNIYYYYDKYERLIKDVAINSSKKKLTHLYTYE